MDAVRFVVRGDPDAYTVMDGERVTMQTRDFITTPNYAWHDHNNDGAQDVIWMDAAVSPLVRGMGVGFAQMYNAARQELAAAGGPSDARATRRPKRFAWADTEADLEALSRQAPDPADGWAHPFCEPEYGPWTLGTLHCAMLRLPSGFQGRRHRHVHATTLHVVEGSGATEIDGKVYEWSAGDSILIPLWTWHRHTCAQDALLFSVDDSAVLDRLGLNRIEVD